MQNKFKLKKFLATASALAMITSASSAMGVTVTTTGDNYNLSTGANISSTAPWTNGNRLDFTGDHGGISGDNAVEISKIVVGLNAPGIFKITDNAGNGAGAATISQVTTALNLLPIELHDGSVLKLNGAGTAYAGLGAIEASNAGNGTITIQSGLTFNQTIGANTRVETVNIEAGGNALTLVGAITATNLNLNNADTLTSGGLITSEVTYNDAATLNSNAGITGNVDFANNAGTLSAGGLITGNVDSTVGANGTLNLTANGAGVTGTIGATKALTKVQFNAGGNAIDLTGNAKATDFTYAAADTVTAAGTITGNVDFANNAGTLNAGGLITGNVDSTVGANGTLNLTANGAGVTGTIGATKALTKVQFNAGGNAIDLTGNAKATDFTYAVADTVTAAGTITGNVDFANNAGTLNAGGLITGNVDSTVGANGTLNLTANGAGVTGTIGATKALTKVQFNAGGNAIDLTGNAKATDFTYAAADTVTAAGTITGNVDFANNAGTLNAGGLITGNVDSTVGANGTLNLTANGAGVTGTIGATKALTKVTANGAGVVTLGGAVTAGTLYIANGATIDAKNSSVAAVGAINIGDANGAGTLIIDANANYIFNVGNAANITFNHANSLLKLTNSTGAGRTVTLQQTIAGDALSKGKIEINSNGTNKLDLDSVVGKNIGTDAANRINELIVSGAKDSIIQPNIFATTISINSTANIVLNGELNGGQDDSVIKLGANTNQVTVNADVTAHTLDLNNTGTTVFLNGGNSTFARITNVGNANIVFNENSNLNLVGENPEDKTVTLSKIVSSANGKAATLGAGSYTVGNIELADANGITNLADGFELTGAFNNGAGNAGKVNFLGDAKVTGVLGGAANATGAVTVAGVNKTLQLGESVSAASLNANAANNQNLKFINAAPITVTGKVGNAQAFEQIEFAGGNAVTFVGAGNLTNPTTLHFSANNEVVTDNFDLGATNITNANGVNASKLTVNVDQTITGNVGTAAQPFGTLHITNDRNITLNTAEFHAGVTTQANNTGRVIFNNAAGSSIRFAGGAGNELAALIFAENGSVLGNVFAKDIEVQDRKTANLTGSLNITNNIQLNDPATTATFTKDNLNVNFNIRAQANGDGIANFDGNDTVINNEIGLGGARLAAVNFNDDASIDADIHAVAINFGAHEITLQNPKEFDGATTFNGTTLTLGEHDLTLTNGNSSFTGATEIKTTVNGVDLGNLVVGNASKATLAGANTLKVTVDDAAAVPVDGQALKLIKTEGTGILDLDLSKVTVDATGAFSKWLTQLENGELVLKQESQIAEVITEAVSQANLSEVISQEVVDAIESFEEGTPGEDFVLQLNQMTTPNIADAVARTTNTTINEVEKNTFATMQEVTEVVSRHVAEVANFSVIPTQSPAVNVNTDSKVSGVASGDEHDRYGVWGTPFYSKATQKKRGSSSGYKSEVYGGTVGFDTKANDDMLVGLAVSAMNSEIKHKDFKSGDKTKVTSYLLSAYATQQFTNNFFGQGVFSIGSSSADNKENRKIANTVSQTAQGKYTSMIFSAEVLGGYNHMLNEQFVVSPMFGLNYSRINSAGYKETGKAGTPLLDVNKQASHKLDIIGGVKLTSAPFMANDVAITPEVHASIRHDVIGKGAKVNAKLAGLNTISEKAKLQKTFYNVGASLNTAYGNMDYGVSADANFADKYVGVQGTVKVRVNF